MNKGKQNVKKRLGEFRNLAWLYFNIGLTVIYLLWRGFKTLPFEYGAFSLCMGIILLAVEVIGMFEAFVHYYNMYRIESYDTPKVPDEEFPDVDIFIATYNEPVDLLYKTVNGCVHMQYPDKSKVHIFLCDDGKRKEVRELAKKMGVGYIDREDNKGAKAGNLNHAMSVTSAPLIATFDADMIPRSNFLMEMVPYFVEREIKNRDLEEKDKVRLGFIQSPQSFYNPDLFQYNLYSENRIPNEQDYFYKDVQVARNKSNSVIYGGSNTLIAREALNAVGGFYTESITEDFATGILIQKKGFKCFAVNKVLASGLSPDTLKSLINQRVRWGRGCIQTGRKMHLFTSKNLTLAQKANYLASIWYWYSPWKRLIYIMSPILFGAFGVVVVKCRFIEVLFFWLPMYISSNVCLKMLSRNIRTTKWTNLYETVIFPFMLFPVLLETLGIRMKKFKVTKKGKKDDSDNSRAYAIPHLALIALSLVGIVNCLRWTFVTGRIDYFIIMFWLFLNMYNLVMSLLFILGRRTMRAFERKKVSMSCKAQTQYEMEEGTTVDISESGVSVIFDNVMDIDKNEPVKLILDDNRYQATLSGQIVLVERKDEKWRYVFLIKDMCESKPEFMQLIYDREPSLPTNLDESVSSFDDLRINITRRLYTKTFENRQRARIPMDMACRTDQKSDANIIDFNYEYILVKNGSALPEICKITICEGITLVCLVEKEFDDGKKLYKVLNYQEIHEDKEQHTLLKSWLCEHMLHETAEKEAEKLSLKKQRMLAADEFSELDYL